MKAFLLFYLLLPRLELSGASDFGDCPTIKEGELHFSLTKNDTLKRKHLEFIGSCLEDYLEMKSLTGNEHIEIETLFPQQPLPATTGASSTRQDSSTSSLRSTPKTTTPVKEHPPPETTLNTQTTAHSTTLTEVGTTDKVPTCPRNFTLRCDTSCANACSNQEQQAGTIKCICPLSLEERNLSCIPWQKETQLNSGYDDCDSACTKLAFHNLCAVGNIFWIADDVKCCNCSLTKNMVKTSWESYILKDDWYLASNGLAYKMYDDERSYDGAKRNCKSKHARLASAGIRNSTVLNELWTKVLNGFAGRAWIGLYSDENKKSNGKWEWSDGVDYQKNFPPWKTLKPDANNNEFCVRMERNKQEGVELDDWSCTISSKYLCETRCRL